MHHPSNYHVYIKIIKTADKYYLLKSPFENYNIKVASSEQILKNFSQVWEEIHKVNTKEKATKHIHRRNPKYGMDMYIYTSPKAPLPIIVSSSKSSTQILCLLSRINSVSFLSKSLIKLVCSSFETHEEANLLSRTHRLQLHQVSTVSSTKPIKNKEAYQYASTRWAVSMKRN